MEPDTRIKLALEKVDAREQFLLSIEFDYAYIGWLLKQLHV